MRAIAWMPTAALILIAVVCLGVIHPEGLSFYSSKPLPKAPAIRELGTYYRFKLDLTYKSTPIHIEFVGGCGVRSTFSVASGGSTVETLAMSAFVFGALMPERHAIVVRSDPVNLEFDVCDGARTPTPYDLKRLAECKGAECRELRSSFIPSNWLPMIIWYEHDNDFSFGTAYATQDAYASSRARFGFVKATVEYATRSDYDHFLITGPKNLLPPYLTDAMTHLDAPNLEHVEGGIPADIIRDPRKAWRYANLPVCRGVSVVKLDEAQRARIRAIWPPNRPRYWVPPEHDRNTEFVYQLLTSQQDPERAETFGLPDTAERKSARPIIYPIRISQGLAEASANTASDGWWYDHDLLLNDPTLRGFEYCESPAPQILLDTLKGSPAASVNNIRCKIENIVMPVDAQSCKNGRLKFFDRDEYALVLKHSID